VQILQAAAAFYLFDILYYFIYEEESLEFFIDLISNILTSRLELKSFILLLGILFAIHHSIQEIASVLREKFLAPNTTIIVDCPKQRESRIKSFVTTYDRKQNTTLPAKSS
jgi:hypothetical protein